MCLGHESSGIIARLGSNLAAAAAEAEQAEAQLGTTGAKAVVGKAVLKLGQKVTLEPGVTCRMCHDCRGGQYQVSMWYLNYQARKRSHTESRSASTWHLLLTPPSTAPCRDTTSCECPLLFSVSTNVIEHQPVGPCVPPARLCGSGLWRYDGAAFCGSARYSQCRRAKNGPKRSHLRCGSCRPPRNGRRQGSRCWEDHRRGYQ